MISHVKGEDCPHYEQSKGNKSNPWTPRTDCPSCGSTSIVIGCPAQDCIDCQDIETSSCLICGALWGGAEFWKSPIPEGMHLSEFYVPRGISIRENKHIEKKVLENLMHIKEVTFGRLKSYGTFENIRIEAKADVGDNESPSDVLDGLKNYVDKRITLDIQRGFVPHYPEQVEHAKVELEQLNEEIHQKRIELSKIQVLIDTFAKEEVLH